MRRRTLLRAGAASLALPTLGTAAGRPPSTASTTTTSPTTSTTATTTTGTASYAPTGSVDVDGAAEVVVEDETAYVAASNGFATVDVSDPADPTLLAERRDLAADRSNGPLVSILDVKVDGDRLLVPGPAQRGQLQGFLLYDVSDPADPRQVGEFFPTTHGIHNAVLYDGYAWLQAGLETHVVDVQEPPFETAARWSPLDADDAWEEVPRFTRVLHDLWVADGRAYLAHWDAGVFVLDATDPTDPTFLGRFGDYSLEQLREWDPGRAQEEYLTPAGNAHYVATNDAGDVAGVGAESWAQGDEGGPGGIDLYDVSDPAAAEKLATINPPGSPDNSRGGTWTTSHNFDFAGDRLYTSWYQGGVMIHDVSDPTAPERLAWWRNLGDAFWTAQVVTPDSHFVATTTAQAGETSRLYALPDGPGEQADPPAEITDPEPPTSGDDLTRVPTATTSPETTTDPDSGDEDDETTDDSGSVPGLGVASALAGVGIGAWRLRRRADAD